MATKRKAAAAASNDYVLPEGCALMLRVCSADMSSSNDFVWPGVGGEAVAPDWNAIAECGNGLHGWLYGQGDHSVASIGTDSKWLVVEVRLSDAVMLGGKCKVPRGTVRFVGDRKSATDWLVAHEPRAAGVAVIGRTATTGDNEAVTVGAYGTATAGYGGTATAGHRGTATAGDSGTATAGDSGTATAGDSGTATAGYGGTATAGDSGTATAGYGGTATAGHRGTATAGDSGEIRIQYYDNRADRFRTASGYIGEAGLLPNVPYRLNDRAEFERADDAAEAA